MWKEKQRPEIRRERETEKKREREAGKYIKGGEEGRPCGKEEEKMEMNRKRGTEIGGGAGKYIK